MTEDSRWASLASLGTAARACVRCPLSLTRTQVVFGDGPVSAPLVVVGEAPGQSEDRDGRPFVGVAGKRLRLLLEDSGLDLTGVYLTNTVLCHPPGRGSHPDRQPHADEVEACRSWLDEQLALVSPRVILAVGRTAAHRLLDSGAPLRELRGIAHRAANAWVVATYHPSALNWAPSRADEFRDDVSLAIALMKRGGGTDGANDPR
jgi:DNA polymerase